MKSNTLKIFAIGIASLGVAFLTWKYWPSSKPASHPTGNGPNKGSINQTSSVIGEDSSSVESDQKPFTNEEYLSGDACSYKIPQFITALPQSATTTLPQPAATTAIKSQPTSTATTASEPQSATTTVPKPAAATASEPQSAATATTLPQSASTTAATTASEPQFATTTLPQSATTTLQKPATTTLQKPVAKTTATTVTVPQPIPTSDSSQSVKILGTEYKIESTTSLSLIEKDLDEFPKEMQKLVNLEEINFSDNLISCFPYWLMELKKLKKLNVSNNKFETSRCIDGLSNLKKCLALRI